MINADMRVYDYHIPVNDGHGGLQVNEIPDRTIKMSINIANIDTQDNSVFGGSDFVGMTRDINVQVGDYIHLGEFSKQYFNKEGVALITFVYKKGRYYQVFLKNNAKTRPKKPVIE